MVIFSEVCGFESQVQAIKRWDPPIGYPWFTHLSGVLLRWIAPDLPCLITKVWSTLLVNWMGCGLLGLITLCIKANPALKLLLGTGFCGGRSAWAWASEFRQSPVAQDH